jgi:hypothetical protein
VPPSRRVFAARLTARFFAPLPADDDDRFEDREAAAVRFFLPCAVFAPAVLRPVFRRAEEARREPAPLRAAARPPDPARLFDGVPFCPFPDPFLEDPAAFRFAVFLAIVFFDPCSGDRAADPAH